MNVLFYSGRFSHPFFREQFQHPPDGVSYIPGTRDLVARSGPCVLKSDLRHGRRLSYRLTRRLTRTLASALGLAGIPRVAWASAGPADLIHSCRHLLLNRRPWVLEVEIASAFAWYSRRNLQNPLLRRAIETRLASPWCRQILPWTEAARRSLLRALDCRRFAHKVQVVYPCIAAKHVDVAARRRQSAINLLFVGPGFYGAGFYNKGGVETLQAFRDLWRKYPQLHLDMVCLPPPAVLQCWAAHPNISFHTRIPAGELERLYRQASIFVLPTHVDTLGFVYLEAFSYGLPCVGPRQFAVPEIIRDGVNGFTFPADYSFDADGQPRGEPPLYEGHPLVELWKQPSETYVAEIIGALEPLIANPELRWRLGDAAYQEVCSGKFSVSRRKWTLRQVYDRALAPARSARVESVLEEPLPSSGHAD